MPIQTTVPGRWRLDSDSGDHQWRYLSEEESNRRPQSTAEKLFLGLQTVYEFPGPRENCFAKPKYQGVPLLSKPESFHDAAVNGWSFYERLQLDDGHWAC